MSEALLQVYRENELALVHFLYKRVRCPHTAADLAQDLYLKLLHTDRLVPIKNLRAYLFSMAANLATDYLRTEIRHAAILDEVGELLWSRENALTPERIVTAHQRMRTLGTVVRGLPPLSRRIFYLNRFEGRSHKQIATELSISTTTVENHIRRVLECLRRHDDHL
jgi:RNA polymerase sigma-70 factor (ECF subfamily)